MDDDLISRRTAVDTLIEYFAFKINKDRRIEVKIPKESTIKEALNQVPSVPQWIPCDDSLPVKVGSYLVCSEHETVFTAFWLGDHWGTPGVVAWAPLPKPYVSGGNGSR